MLEVTFVPCRGLLEELLPRKSWRYGLIYYLSMVERIMHICSHECMFHCKGYDGTVKHKPPSWFRVLKCLWGIKVLALPVIVLFQKISIPPPWKRFFLRPPLPTHPSGNSIKFHTYLFIFCSYTPLPQLRTPGNFNPCYGGSMDIFWNCTLRHFLWPQQIQLVLPLFKVHYDLWPVCMLHCCKLTTNEVLGGFSNELHQLVHFDCF